MGQKANEHRIQKLLLSAISASVAEAATFPLDAAKTRMQLNYSQSANSLLTTLHRVAWKEGPGSLYAGLFPALLRHVPYTGVRISLFEALKNTYSQRTGRDDSALPLGPSLTFGLVSGGIGQLVAVPCDVIKVRMQADRLALASGKQPCLRYPTTWSALVDVTRGGGGVIGLLGAWRGSLPAISRAALVNLGELSTYDAAKRTILNSWIVKGRFPSDQEEPIFVHVLSSICSGFVASAVSTPADVVKSRLMAVETGASNPMPYRNIGDCVVRTVREEGIRGLYKGFFPTWARLGPWQLVFWTTYEKLRSVGGLSGF